MFSIQNFSSSFCDLDGIGAHNPDKLKGFVNFLKSISLCVETSYTVEQIPDFIWEKISAFAGEYALMHFLIFFFE